MDESCSRFQAVLRRFKRRFTNWLQSRYLPWHLAVLAMVLCAPSLSLGLQTDDLFHRAALINQPALPEMSRSPSELFVFFRGDSDATHEAIDRGLVPWRGRSSPYSEATRTRLLVPRSPTTAAGS